MKTALEVLTEESGLLPETIQQSYSWALRAMEKHANRFKPEPLTAERIAELLPEDNIYKNAPRTRYDSPDSFTAKAYFVSGAEWMRQEAIERLAGEKV